MYSGTTGFIIEVLLNLLKIYPGVFLVTCGLIIVSIIADIFVTYSLGNVINSLKEQKTLRTGFAVFIFALLCSRVIKYITEYNDSAFIPKLQIVIRDLCSSELINHIRDEYDYIDIGKLLVLIGKLPGAIEMFIVQLKRVIIPFLLLATVLCFILSKYDYTLSIGIFMIIVLYFAVSGMTTNSCKDMSYDRDQQYAIINSFTEDIFKNLSAIYSTNSIAYETKRIDEANTTYMKFLTDSLRCGSKIHIVIFIFTISLALYLITNYYHLVEHKSISSQMLLVVILLTMQILNLFMNTGDIISHYANQHGVFHSLFDHINNEVVLNPHLPSSEGARIGAVITMKDVTTTHSKFPPLTQTIKPHDFVLVIGANGVGKSSLLRCIAVATKPKTGQLDVYADNVGYVPPNATLWTYTLYENLVYGHGKNKRTLEETKELLVRFGLQNKLPVNELDKTVGKLGANLSSGQRQLVYCLRVLTNIDSDVFILDEPTNWIDAEAKRILVNLIQNIYKSTKKTFLISTHDDDLMKLATMVIRLDKTHLD